MPKLKKIKLKAMKEKSKLNQINSAIMGKRIGKLPRK